MSDPENLPSDEELPSIQLPSDQFETDAEPEAEAEQDPIYTPPSIEDLASASPENQGLVPLIGISADELKALYERRITQIGPQKFMMQVSIPGSYENLLWFSFNNYSTEAARAREAIAEIDDKTAFSSTLSKDGKVILSNQNFRQQKPKETKMVSGEAGVVAMLSTRKNQIRRVSLYNSGFGIDLRVPSIDALSTTMRKCRADLDEYGREFGSHFYVYSDLIIKRTVFETLLTLCVGTTLKDWRRPGSLAQRLKITDYDVILSNIASLMYPEGYPGFRHICTRPEDAEHPTGCDHVTVINADPTKLVLSNYSALNEAAVAHMVKCRSGIEVTNKMLDAYQAELGFDGTVIKFDNFEFVMTVPSMADYFIAGEAFNADLLNEISANNKNEIYAAIGFRESRLYLPWIKRLTCLQEDGTSGLVSEDKLVISEILDNLAAEDTEGTLVSAFVKFINKSKISHVCYPAFACESCGYFPKTESGFLTVDAQHSFFIQSTQKLRRSQS